MKRSKTSPVPRNRLSRLAHLGSLAGSVAGGMLAEGLRQAARSKAPLPSDLLLTPSNARRVAEESVESLTSAPQATRDHVMGLLLKLLFRELFEFRLIQTDPNFANFLYNVQTAQLGLLDFGATRRYSGVVTEGYRGLLAAALRNDHDAMAQSAGAIGYFKQNIDANQRAAVIELFMLATEPARNPGRFDFGASDLALRIRDAGMVLSFDRGYWHTPPAGEG